MAAALFQGKLQANPLKSPENVKHLTFYVMGANYSEAVGNYWATMDQWPTPKSTNFYMHSDDTLTPSEERGGNKRLRSFSFDPKDPVPTIGGNNLEIKCGPLDQRPTESGKRSDVLTFTTTPLTKPMVITGDIFASLWVSSANVNDTDWTVKLTDVYPSGASHLIQDGIVRMRWRKGGTNPHPIVPKAVEQVNVSLWTTSYVFSPGHRIRVSVSSSNYPRFLVNPNTGRLLSDYANDTIIAKNTLHMSKEYPSHFVMPVVTLDQLPKHPIVNDLEALPPAIKNLADALGRQAQRP